MDFIDIDAKYIEMEKIRTAADIIKDGGIVAFPTETVYGLGADAFNPLAVARIFEVKKRPSFDPLIVHISDPSDIEILSSDVDERTRRLVEAFWPGPLTVVVKKLEVVPDIVTAGLPTVAIRMPAHAVALELIREAETPLAAPSANPFGYISPSTPEHVKEQIGSDVDLIIDGGRCMIGVESTVIDLTRKDPILLRPGGLPLEEIEDVIGPVKTSRVDPDRPNSPGQLLRHYSPRTQIKIIGEEGFEAIPGKRTGLLAFTPQEEMRSFEVVEVLSKNGDFREAASNLFFCLHRLDKAGLDVIYVEPVPEVGLGRAIMDRLNRAAGIRRE
ncbi:MAG: L-threonylcarbamoyladenylate synthase [Halobacteriota archaeon]|nr:L-threonylcarbamoyladenylate synthase [Halobacteriota archaeon]